MAKQKYDITNLKQRWEAESAYVKVFTEDFPDLDRLVDAVGLQNDDKNPNMADTTTASSVRALPKKSLKQLPVFSVEVNGTKYSMEAIMLNYILKDVVFNDDTFGKGILSTLQLAMIQAVTHGFATMFVAKSKLYDDFGTILRLINYNDFGIERGIQDGNQTGHDFIRTNIPRSRFEEIIEDAENDPDTTYDVKVIRELLELQPDGENYAGESIETNQKQANAPTDAYQVITFHNYKKTGKTVLFNPQQQEPFQVLDNRSKFSYPRLIMLVIDPAALNPFGLSRVRLASPNQRFLNALRQNVGYTWLYNSSPALLQLGQFATAVSLKRNALIKSTDYQANVKPILLDTSTAQQYPTISEQVQRQIIDIIAGTASALGAIGQSKTGVGAQTQKENLDDNTAQLTNLAENTLRQYALVALDVILSESDGTEDIIVDDETKARLNEIEPGSVGDDNTVHNVSYASLYANVKKLKVEIDVSIGKQEADAKKAENLTAALANASQNADPNNPSDMQFKSEIMEEYRKTILPDKPTNTPMPVKLPEPEAPAMPQLPTADVAQSMGIPQSQ